MTTPRPFRWLPHEGQRHAVCANSTVRDEVTTLCGGELVIPVTRPTKAEWCWPTCLSCDAAWRAAEGIMPFPRKASAGPSRGARADRRGR
ncbi:zinc finger protein [Saccharothrix longispora]|uniref:zinc finger protein n=1 Tax=Saccharothrix longispora TaxID=33920 RepID=UPI00286A9B47|nr:zinc finger protein [Saccharothrix longispora]